MFYQVRKSHCTPVGSDQVCRMLHFVLGKISQKQAPKASFKPLRRRQSINRTLYSTIGMLFFFSENGSADMRLAESLGAGAEKIHPG